MALDLSCDREWSGSLHSSPAAEHSEDLIEMYDYVFDSLISNVAKCEYVNIDKDNIFTIEIDSLILVHLNIRTLNKYYDDLHNLIASLPFKPDVICLSESRIDKPFENIEIEGYNFVHVKPNTKGQAGGVAIYINIRFEYKKN